MDLKQFRCFVAVIEKGTVTGAAAELRLAQSAVSRHVRALEREMGVRLLERRRSGMTPTEAGMTMYERAKAVLASTGRMKDEVSAAGSIVTGHVRFSAPNSLAALLFPTLARNMRALYPQIQLSFSELITAAAISAIRSDLLDVAIVASVGQTEGLLLETVFEERLCYVQKANSPPHKLHGGKLSGTLIMPPDAGWRRHLEIEPTASIVEVDSMMPMAEMVRMGIGSALMPMIATRNLAPQDLRAKLLPDIRLRRSLAWSQDRRLSRAVTAFLDVCRPQMVQIGKTVQISASARKSGSNRSSRRTTGG